MAENWSITSRQCALSMRIATTTTTTRFTVSDPIASTAVSTADSRMPM